MARLLCEDPCRCNEWGAEQADHSRHKPEILKKALYYGAFLRMMGEFSRTLGAKANGCVLPGEKSLVSQPVFWGVMAAYSAIHDKPVIQNIL